jgi:hypothetical protein
VAPLTSEQLALDRLVHSAVGSDQGGGSRLNELTSIAFYIRKHISHDPFTLLYSPRTHIDHVHTSGLIKNALLWSSTHLWSSVEQNAEFGLPLTSEQISLSSPMLRAAGGAAATARSAKGSGSTAPTARRNQLTI